MSDVQALLRARLNPAQYAAVTALEGPVLVVAGAGTGKTRVIEYRVLNLIDQGIPPEAILLLTFTRRAARQMLDRAAGHNQLCQEVVGGTFHSFGYSVITRYCSLLGYRRPISFLDETDSEQLLHRLATRLGFTGKEMRFPARATLKQVVSASFNRSVPIGEILLKDYPHFVHWTNEIEKLREEYVRYKVGHNLLDYDDLLIYLKILLENADVQATLTDRHRFVMVDEYQDTNFLQAEIVALLAKRHRNCMAVGDDAQSIYAFRGARFQNMFDFLQAFPEARVIKLEENYRSTQPILDLANAVIDRARQKHTKVLKAHEEGGGRPGLLFFKDPEQEAEWIAARVKELWDEGIPLHHIGVLFRSMYIGRSLEVALTRRGIPYQTYGGLKFIETAHVKDLISHIKITANPLDELAWHRCLLLLDGIGPRIAEEIIAAISQSGDWRTALAAWQGRQRFGQALMQLSTALEQASTPGLPFAEAVTILADYYFPLLQKRYDDYQRRQADVDSLRQIAMTYQSVEPFLLDLVAIEPAEKSLEERQDIHLDTRPLVLSTIHSAKGLEWDAVFVMGVADGHLPISYSYQSEDDQEEERRLLYVSITRAKQELFLTIAHEGYRGGITTFSRLSRFLDSPQILRFLDITGREQLAAAVEDLARFRGGTGAGGIIADKENLVQRILGKIRPD
jgi:DNA helicase-2/ATP-dependent DNA helicase PcrA